MTLDIRPFSSNAKPLFDFLEKNKNRKVDENIAEFSASSGCPIIALYYYYRDKFGNSEEIENKILSLMKFYGILKIQE